MNQAQWCSSHAKGVECHPEGPGPVWAVDPWEPHEFQQGQIEGPATGSGQLIASMQTWGWRGGEQTCWEGLGGLKASHEAANELLQTRRTTLCWIASKRHDQKGWGKWFSPSISLWWDPIWSTQAASGPEKTPEEDYHRAGTVLLWKGWKVERLKGLELLSLKKTPGRTYCGLSSPLKRT